jgi:hypothetical protein
MIIVNIFRCYILINIAEMILIMSWIFRRKGNKLAFASSIGRHGFRSFSLRRHEHSIFAVS